MLSAAAASFFRRFRACKRRKARGAMRDAGANTSLSRDGEAGGLSAQPRGGRRLFMLCFGQTRARSSFDVCVPVRAAVFRSGERSGESAPGVYDKSRLRVTVRQTEIGEVASHSAYPCSVAYRITCRSTIPLDVALLLSITSACGRVVSVTGASCYPLIQP